MTFLFGEFIVPQLVYFAFQNLNVEGQNYLKFWIHETKQLFWTMTDQPQNWFVFHLGMQIVTTYKNQALIIFENQYSS